MEAIKTQSPNGYRLLSHNERLRIDGRASIGILDYYYDGENFKPFAVWVKIKPHESKLEREANAQCLLASKLLQTDWTMKEVADYVKKDSTVGQVVNYFAKNLDDIFNGVPAERVPDLNTDPYRS